MRETTWHASGVAGPADVKNILDDNPMEVFYRNGNVILTIDDQKMRVSAEAIGLASPVLEALVKYDCAADRSVELPAQVKLEEDDPFALRVLLRMIHHLPMPIMVPTPEFLLAIATLVDKYQARFAAWPHLNKWFHRCTVADLQSSSHFSMLLEAACLLRDTLFFKRAVRSLILSRPKTFLNEIQPARLRSLSFPD